jgi:abequosyltransferase
MNLKNFENSTLLSIVIPTWNRCEILKLGLSRLLPQLLPFSDFVELVISDNCSNDETRSVIDDLLKNFKQLKFKYNRNSENLGFFGNFKVCRALAQGRYIWVLSDDDFISEGVFRQLFETLRSELGISSIFLKNIQGNSDFRRTKLSNRKLLESESYSLGLISSVVFLNVKADDDLLFTKYLDSPFIAFIFYLNSFKWGDESFIIRGNCYSSANARPVGYNYFEVFVVGMNDVLDYMCDIGIEVSTRDQFRYKYYKDFIFPTYMTFKVNRKLDFTDCEVDSINKVEKLIINNYFGLFYFWIFFYPVKWMPRTFLSFLFKLFLVLRKVKHWIF